MISRYQRSGWWFAKAYNYCVATWNYRMKYDETDHRRSYRIVTDQRHRLWFYRRWQQYLISKVMDFKGYPDHQNYWIEQLELNSKFAGEKLKRHNAFNKRANSIRSIEP